MASLNALYIHWPFCVSKCPYCDFNSHVRASLDEDLWERCLLQELEFTAQKTDKKPLSSLFFGGGTPSLMPPSIVASLIKKAESLYGFTPSVEITLEANPGTYDETRFRDFSYGGVNRLSLGVQSFNDDNLRFLGRIHNSKEARIALDSAYKLFPKVSFDLIYALPNQSLSSWNQELDTALSYDPSHLSLYQLTFEEGTPFTHRKNTGQIVPLPDEEALGLYLFTQEWMEAKGLPRYEISNHARPGYESVHNLTYWLYKSYSGIGPGAHGRCIMNDQKHLSRCLKNPEKWIRQVTTKGHGWEEVTPLAPLTLFEEAILMGLRLTQGIQWKDLETLSQPLTQRLKESRQFSILIEEGFISKSKDRVQLTHKGLLTQSACVSFLLNEYK